MTYTISNTVNGSITIPAGSINTTSASLSFIGSNVTGFGNVINQNTLNLLVNSAGSTAPSNSLIGQLWFDSGNNVLRYYENGRAWDAIASQGWVNTNFATTTGTNASGTWPINISGNSATTTTATKVANSITPGSYLIGSAYNGSSAQTWSVNASTNATPNTLAAYDSNGNISIPSLQLSQYVLVNGNLNNGVGTGTPPFAMSGMSAGTIAFYDGKDPDPLSGSYSPVYTYTISMDVAKFSFLMSTSTTQWAAGSTLAYIDQSGNIWCGGTLTQASDERLKTDVKTLKNPMSKVKKLRGVSFKRKSEMAIEELREEIGLIAQEVQKVIPEVVHEGDDGYLSVSYQNLIGLLIEAVKDLDKRLSKLEKPKK